MKHLSKTLKSIADGLENFEESFAKFLAKARTEKNQPIDFDLHPFLKQPYFDFSQYQVHKKGTQVGITTKFSIKELWLAGYRQFSVIHTFPSADDATTFSKMRFNSIVSFSNLDLPMSIDSLISKKIGLGNIYFKGTFTEKQALEVPSDLNVHDELDFSKADVMEIYEKRLSASTYKWIWCVSTPTIEDFGIDKLWKQSDMKVWLIQCQHCNKWQQVNYFLQKALGSIDYVCIKCHKSLDRMVGKWVPQNRESKVSGYFMPQTICPWIKLSELKKAEENAFKLRNFYNFNLGETYSEGVDVLTRDMLYQFCTEEISLDRSSEVVVGCDQGDILHIVVAKYNNGKRQIVYVERTKDINRLDELMAIFNVRLWVIDALPYKPLAKAFASRYPGKVKIVYYHEMESTFKKGTAINSMIVDRTEILDRAAEEYTSGKVILPQRNFVIDEFVKQMCNMKRDSITNRFGDEKHVWISTGADHFRHADSYCSLGFILSNLHVTISAKKAFEEVSKTSTWRLSDLMVDEEIDDERDILDSSSRWRKFANRR